MLTGVDVDKVISDFHEKYTNREMTPSDYLLGAGVHHLVNNNPFDSAIDDGSVYLLTVASLNSDGGMHSIIVDLRGKNEKVFDPNKGVDGKRYYVGWSQNTNEGSLAVNLMVWKKDLEVFFLGANMIANKTKESMPERGDEVLFFAEKWTVGYWDGEQWNCYNSQYKAENVTHWADLPW